MNRRTPHYAAAQPADCRPTSAVAGMAVEPAASHDPFDLDGTDVSISGCVVTTDMCSS